MVNAPSPPAWPRRYEVTVIEASPPGGFWIRFVAYVIDGLVLGMLAMVVAAVFIAFVVGSGETVDDDRISPAIVIAALLLIAAFIVMAWLYEALLTSSARGATLGKQALGLRVVQADGAPLSFGRATARHFLKVLVTPATFSIGYLMAAFTARKRALHDVLADTLVIRSR